MKLSLILVVILTLTPFSPVYPNKEDSLKAAISRQTGSQQIETIQTLASVYFTIDIDLSMKYYREALKESHELNDTMLIAKSIANIAAININKSLYQKALDSFQLSSDLFEKIKYYPGAVFAQSQMGNVYNELGKYDKAIQYFTKALSYFSKKDISDSLKAYRKLKGKLSEDQKRFLNVHSVAINDFALNQYYLQYYGKAMELFKQALEIGLVLGRKDRIGAAYSNMAMVYNSYENDKEAEIYYKKAQKLFEEYPHYKYLSNTLINLANIYIERKDYKLAKTIAYEALFYSTKTKDSSTSIFNTIAEIEFRLGNYDKSSELFQEAEKIYSEHQLLPLLTTTYYIQSKLYAEKNNYKAAYYFSQKYILLKDSIINIKKYDQIGNLLSFYDVESKEKEILLLKKDNELSNIKLKQREFQSLIYIVIAFLLAIILLGFIIAFYFRQKGHKTIEEKNIQLEALNNELQDLNQTKDNFFSIIAHDIKNPLGSIKQVSELLIDDTMEITPTEQREFLVSVNTSSLQLLKLLENLLTWARSQTGKLALNPERVNFDVAVAGEIAILEVQTEKKDITINYANSNLMLYADPNMLNTVLRNFLTNAIKFTRQGGEINVFTKVETDFARISIKDNGVGMSEEMVEKLFKIDNNRSTRGTNDEEGTGLGLLISKEFVDRNGGTISVESKPDEGTTFSFTVPLFKKNK